MTESNGSPIGPTVGAGLGAVGGAGYNFDPDQIAALLPKWEVFRDAIDEDLMRLRMAGQVAQAPSADPPATSNALRVNASIRAAMEHNAALRSYAQAWIDNLKKANGTYRTQDDTVLQGLQGAAETANGSGLYEQGHE